MGEKTLTVGEIPARRGMWLGVANGSEWRALAKFRSEEAAQEFMELMRWVARGSAVITHDEGA